MIVTANLIVFGMILQRVFGGHTIRRHMQSKRKLAMRQVTTSVLLFFLLGLSWVFGLMGGLSTLCAYLFCITATLQGFVMFLFFVLGEKKTRHHWIRGSAIRRSATSTASTPAERMNLRRRDETTGP
jgi:Na+/proline symporter